MELTKEQHEKAQALIDAAEDYFKACGGFWGPAIRWLQDSRGRVVIFTRGEYTSQLLRNIPGYVPTEFFEVPS